MLFNTFITAVALLGAQSIPFTSASPSPSPSGSAAPPENSAELIYENETNKCYFSVTNTFGCTGESAYIGYGEIETLTCKSTNTYEKMENFCGDGTLWFFYDWDNGASEIKDAEKNWLYYQDGQGEQQTWSLDPQTYDAKGFGGSAKLQGDGFELA